MKSAKPAEDAIHTPDAPAFYVWKVPGTAVHIRMRLDVVRRIREYLTGAAFQVSEAGGLLIGNPHARWTEISDFAPISRSSEASPHFVLSDAEKTELRRYIEEVNHTSSENSVIGYFRSDVREGVRLYDEDQKLVQEIFPDPSNVFLVVHTSGEDLATAGFFFSDNGAIFSSFSFMEFEFDEAMLATQIPSPDDAVSASSDANGSGGATAVSEESTRSRELFAIHGSHGGKHSARRLAVPAGIGIALISVAGYLYSNRAKESAPPATTSAVSRTRAGSSASLGLSVATSGPVINISWDSKSPLVTAARVGLLTIDDGGERRDLPLTKVQLLSSKLVYTRTTDTVHIALETYGEDGSVTRENVIALGNTASKADKQYETRVNAAVPTTSEVQETKRAPVRDFVAPEQRVATQQLENPAPPVEPPASIAARLDLRQMPPTQQAPPGVPAAPPAAVPPPPQEDAPPGFSARPTQPIQIVPQTQPRSPVPVRQVKPVLPDNVKAMLTSRASVKVRVQVDASGRVTGADPIVTGGSLERILSTAAASAAKMWVFQPATEGDRRVPSELTVEFTFVPEMKKR